MLGWRHPQSEIPAFPFPFGYGDDDEAFTLVFEACTSSNYPLAQISHDVYVTSQSPFLGN